MQAVLPGAGGGCLRICIAVGWGHTDYVEDYVLGRLSGQERGGERGCVAAASCSLARR